MSEIFGLAATHILYLVVCLGVAAAAVCRIDELTRKRNKYSWFVMYLLYVVYAVVVLLEALHTHQLNAVHLLGLAALGLNLGVTLPAWQAGAPRSSCKPGCEP